MKRRCYQCRSRAAGFGVLDLLVAIGISGLMLALSAPTIRSIISEKRRQHQAFSGTERLTAVAQNIGQEIIAARTLSAFDGFSLPAANTVGLDIPDTRFFFRVLAENHSTGELRLCLPTTQVVDFAKVQATSDRWVAFSTNGYLTLGGKLKKITRGNCGGKTEYRGNFSTASGPSWRRSTLISAAALGRDLQMLVPFKRSLEWQTDQAQTLRRNFGPGTAAQPQIYNFGTLSTRRLANGDVEIRFESARPKTPPKLLTVPPRAITEGQVLDVFL